MSVHAEDALVAAILADPDDDAPRLVYADFLDDDGDDERAEILRVQCALDALPFDDDRVSALEARAYRLIARNLADWTDGLPYVRLRRGLPEQARWWHPATFSGAEAMFGVHPLRDIEIGAQDEPGWGAFVAACPHLARVDTLRLTQMRSHVTELSDFTEILGSEHLTGLRGLDASGGHRYGDIVVDTLRDLPSVARLERLSLAEMALTDAGVRALTDCPLAETLTHLDLSSNEGALDGIDALFDGLLPRLQALNLGGPRLRRTGIVDRLLRALDGGALRTLGLQWALGRGPLPAGLVDAPWGSLSALDLGHGELGSTGGIRQLVGCAQLAGLRTLRLNANGLTDDDVALLADCPHLTGLTALSVADNPITDRALALLADSPYLRRLVYLNVDGAVGDDGIARFARSENARHLRIWVMSGGVGDAGLLAMADTPHLERLTTLVFGGRPEGAPPATDVGAIALCDTASLPNLACVDRHWGSVTDAGAIALAGCERLAWPGWWSADTPEIRAAAAHRAGFALDDLFFGDPLILFPWSTYAFG